MPPPLQGAMRVLSGTLCVIKNNKETGPQGQMALGTGTYSPSERDLKISKLE